MTGQCFVGIDVGLTAAKAVAFDSSGREIGTQTTPNPRAAVGAGVQEVDMNALWDGVTSALVALSGVLTTQGYSVAAVGVTGHGNGIYLVDDQLEPVRPGIPSTDSRCESLLASLDPDKVALMQRATGSQPWSAQTGVLLKWLADNEPGVVENTRWVMLCKDWITAKLTGQASSEVSDFSAAGLLDLRSEEVSSEALDAIGLDRSLTEKIPPLFHPDDIVGHVSATAAGRSHLPEGTPVVAGSIDVVAAPIGAGSTGSRDVTIISGTWGINSVVHQLGPTSPDVTLNALFTKPGHVLAQEDAPTSMGNLEWLRGILAGFGLTGISTKDIVELAMGSQPGARGLLYLPFVYGAPRRPGASGTLVGFLAHHEAGDIARAFLEGITLFHRLQVESLRGAGVQLTSTPWTLAGGGARSPEWAQIFADVMNQPVKLQTEPELGARGVALMGASATGNTDVASWVSVDSAGAQTITPGINTARYAELREEFRSVLELLGGWWSNRAH